VSFFYEEQHLAFLREGYKHFSIAELTVEFNRHFKENRSEGSIRAATKNHKIKSGRTGRFAKGSKPWNKGVRGYTGANATSFKKGIRPHTWVPVGTETTTTKDNYWKVKVAEPNKWEFGHRLVWQQHNGPIPKGKAVVFKDGNKDNWRDITNLELIDRAVLLQYNKNRYGALPPELRTTGRLLAKITVAAGRRQKTEDKAQ